MPTRPSIVIVIVSKKNVRFSLFVLNVNSVAIMFVAILINKRISVSN